MTGQANAQVHDDDGEVIDTKPDIQQIFGSKKVQEEFDQHCNDLISRIGTLNEQVIELNRVLNRRNNSIVNDVTEIIHSVLHETQEVSLDVADFSKGKPIENNFMD